jgi:hypothetical protein
MQPAEQGQTTAGALARGIGAGGDVEARLSKEEFERQKHEDEIDKSNRTLGIRQQEADAYSTAQTNRTTTDRMAIQNAKDAAAAARLGTKNHHQAAIETFAAVQKAKSNVLYDPTKPDPLVSTYGDKTIPEIERMLRSGVPGDATVTPPQSSTAGKPKTVRQNGITYTLQPDGSYQ